MFRIYKDEHLTISQRQQKKLLVQRNPMSAAKRPNQIWAMDFIFDTTEIGRSLKTLIVLDEFTRYLVAAVVESSMNSSQVTRVLDNAILMDSKPECFEVTTVRSSHLES